MEQQSKELMELYFQTKDTFERNRILKHLLCDMPFDAKDFFLQAFKKERYLDMKLSAVRGYAAYATENEVCVLMNKLLQLLKKRPEKTPYNYTEYEPMRSVSLCLIFLSVITICAFVYSMSNWKYNMMICQTVLKIFLHWMKTEIYITYETRKKSGIL